MADESLAASAGYSEASIAQETSDARANDAPRAQNEPETGAPAPHIPTPEGTIDAQNEARAQTQVQDAPIDWDSITNTIVEKVTANMAAQAEQQRQQATERVAAEQLPSSAEPQRIGTVTLTERHVPGNDGFGEAQRADLQRLHERSVNRMLTRDEQDAFVDFYNQHFRKQQRDPHGGHPALEVYATLRE